MKHRIMSLVLPALGLVFVSDLGLALWIGKRWYPTLSKFDYCMTILDSLTAWTGRVVWTGGALIGVTLALRRGRPPRFLERDEVFNLVGNAAPKVIRKPHVAIPLLVLLAALAPTLVIAFWTHVQLPPGATVLSTVDVPGGRKEIFVAIESAGQVSIFGVEGLQKARDAITIGDPLTPGKPLRVAVAPSRGANGEVYVLDAGTGKVWIVDRGTHAVVGEIAVGKAPRWIVVTPDERKAYVSNEQPIPQGLITVIDLKTKQITQRISGVNCPEGLVMSPDGKRLYVITQCGAGLDPVFVVDTATDKVVDSISGLAVGLSGVITPNGKKLYVARGGFTTRNVKTGQTIEIPAQISVITTADLRVVKDVPLNAFALATTHDGGHLLVGGEKRLDIVDTKTDEIINTIPLGTSPAGLTATEDQRIFVWLPAENRLFLTGLGGLVPSRKSKQ